MKKLLLSAVLLIIAVSAFAFSGEDVPVAVKAKFTSEFPSAKKIKWDNEDGKFEASFNLNGVETSATYDANGNKLEVESEISASAFPKGVTDYVAKNYPNEKIKEAARITDGKGTITYEAEVKAGDLIFDTSGNFLQLKTAKAEKKDDEKKEKK